MAHVHNKRTVLSDGSQFRVKPRTREVYILVRLQFDTGYTAKFAQTTTY